MFGLVLKMPLIGNSIKVAIEATEGATIYEYDFNVLVSGGSGSYTYMWFVDDTPVGLSQSITYKFNPSSIETTYTVMVIVVDTNNNIAQSSIDITIASSITYLFQQEFNSFTPEIGTLTYVETDGSFAIADGKLNFSQQSSPSWGDQGFYSDDAIVREKGIASVLAFILTDVTGDAYPLTFLSAQNINNVAGANVNAGIQYSTGRYNPVSNGSAADFLSGALGSPIINWENRIAVVLRDTGAFILFKGGSSYNWELLWVADTGTISDLYLGFSNLTIGGDLYHLRSSNLVDANFPEWDDNYALATQRTASPSDGGVVAMEADAIIEITWTPVAAETLTLLFRRTDDDNCYKLVCDQAAGTIKLFRRESGSDTELDSGKTQTWTAGIARRITIRCDGTNIDTIVATTRKHSVTGQTFNSTATGVKASGFTTASDLICWQRQLSGDVKTILDAVSVEDAFADNPNGFSATNANSALTIPTYDGSGQATHPSVLDFGIEKWNGYRYWMAMTPYPNGDDTKENPSILVSDDGDTWTVPSGLTNPIVELPGVGWYYSDPDLLYADGYLYCFYRSSEGGTDNIYVRKSSNGVTWGDQTLLFTATLATTLSPSVLWDGTQYVMYTIDPQVLPGVPRKLQRRTCATPDGTWSSPVDCTYYGAAAGVTSIWHLDVVKTNTGYHGVANTASGAGSVMLFLTSRDGIKWYQSLSNLLNLGSGSNWDSGMLYRGSMTRTPTGYDLWYSATDGDDNATWGIGKTAISNNLM